MTMSQRAQPTSWIEYGLGFLPWVAWLLASLPLFVHGFPRGHDWDYELTRVAEFGYAWRSGQIPPFWAENIYSGYGAPVFLFYAPLHAATAALGSAVLDSYRAGATAALLVFSAAGLLAMRGLARTVVTAVDPSWETAAASRIAVYVYLLNPYLICDVFLRNADAEYAALCLLPIALHGVLVRPSAPRRGAALIALGLAVLILAHNLTALVGSALVLAVGVVLLRRGTLLREGISLAASIALGLLVASFFWVPAFVLHSRVNVEDLVAGSFDFHQHFAPLAKIFGWHEFYAVGPLTLILLVASLAVLEPGRGGFGAPAKRLIALLSAGALASLFLVTRWSVAFWDTLPLAFFQFPWRFLGPLAFFVAVLSALAAGRLLQRMQPGWRRASEVLVLLLAAANAAPHLADVRPLSPSLRQPVEASLAAATIRQGEHRVTVLDELLPRGAHREMWQRLPATLGPVVGTRGSVRYEVERDESRHIRLAVQADEPDSLRMARWAFPGWELRLNGEPAPLRENRFGSIDVDVPAGTSHVELTLRPPFSRRILLGPSLAGLAVALWLLLARRPRPRQTEDERSRDQGHPPSPRK